MITANTSTGLGQHEFLATPMWASPGKKPTDKDKEKDEDDDDFDDDDDDFDDEDEDD